MPDRIIYDESGFEISLVPEGKKFEDELDPVILARSKYADSCDKRKVEKNGSLVAFITRDSGKRAEYETGARRDTNEGKGRFDLIPPGPLCRLAQLYERGAKKYGDRNWEKGIPLWSYLDSAERHLNQIKDGDTVEDHAAAVVFNMFGYIFTEEKILDGDMPRSLADGCPWVPESKQCGS